MAPGTFGGMKSLKKPSSSNRKRRQMSTKLSNKASIFQKSSINEPVEVPQSARRPKKNKFRIRSNTLKCTVCAKTVYTNEKLMANNFPYHKKCFRCSVCSNRLTVSNFHSIHNDLFCRPCLNKSLSEAGGKFSKIETTSATPGSSITAPKTPLAYKYKQNTTVKTHTPTKKLKGRLSIFEKKKSTTPAPSSSPNTAKPKSRLFRSKANKCQICSKTVYKNEKITADKLHFHIKCFRCKVCSTRLTVSKFQKFEGDIFCRPCFTRELKRAGGKFSRLSSHSDSKKRHVSLSDDEDNKAITDSFSMIPEAPPSDSDDEGEDAPVDDTVEQVPSSDPEAENITPSEPRAKISSENFAADVPTSQTAESSEPETPVENTPNAPIGKPESYPTETETQVSESTETKLEPTPKSSNQPTNVPAETEVETEISPSETSSTPEPEQESTPDEIPEPSSSPVETKSSEEIANSLRTFSSHYFDWKKKINLSNIYSLAEAQNLSADIAQNTSNILKAAQDLAKNAKKDPSLLAELDSLKSDIHSLVDQGDDILNSFVEDTYPDELKGHLNFIAKAGSNPFIDLQVASNNTISEQASKNLLRNSISTVLLLEQMEADTSSNPESKNHLALAPNLASLSDDQFRHHFQSSMSKDSLSKLLSKLCEIRDSHAGFNNLWPKKSVEIQLQQGASTPLLIEQIRHYLKTFPTRLLNSGSILLISGTDSGSTATKLAVHSRFSGVGMILHGFAPDTLGFSDYPLLWTASPQSPTGAPYSPPNFPSNNHLKQTAASADLHDLAAFLHHSISQDPQIRLCIRPIESPIAGASQTSIKNFVDSVMDGTFSNTFSFDPYDKKDLSELYVFHMLQTLSDIKSLRPAIKLSRTHMYSAFLIAETLMQAGYLERDPPSQSYSPGSFSLDTTHSDTPLGLTFLSTEMPIYGESVEIKFSWVDHNPLGIDYVSSSFMASGYTVVNESSTNQTETEDTEDVPVDVLDAEDNSDDFISDEGSDDDFYYD